jgi:hypothetical protein
MTWRPVSLPSDEELQKVTRDLSSRARFLIDESLGIGVAELLREANWNVKFVDEVGLRGRSDEDVFAYAYREDRILLAHDVDFLNDRRFPPHRNPGVIVLPGAAGEEVTLAKALGLAISLVGHLRKAYRQVKLYVSPDLTITIRRRDSETGAMNNTRYRFDRGVLEEWR